MTRWPINRSRHIHRGSKHVFHKMITTLTTIPSRLCLRPWSFIKNTSQSPERVAQGSSPELAANFNQTQTPPFCLLPPAERGGPLSGWMMRFADSLERVCADTGKAASEGSCRCGVFASVGLHADSHIQEIQPTRRPRTRTPPPVLVGELSRCAELVTDAPIVITPGCCCTSSTSKQLLTFATTFLRLTVRYDFDLNDRFPQLVQTYLCEAHKRVEGLGD